MTPDTIKVKTSDILPHSKLGIASCVIAVFVFIYFFVAGYISLYAMDDFFKGSNSVAVLGIAVVAFFIHLAVCIVGFIIGLTFSIVGFITKDKKRLFPAIGLILNATPIILSLGYLIYFFYF